MSLQGVPVAVTASRQRSEAISFLLEDEGAQLLHLPVLELLPPADPRPFAAMVEQLQRYRWILLSSLEAVVALWEGARVAGTRPLLAQLNLIATDAAVGAILLSLGQRARIQLEATPTPSTLASLRADLEVDAEVLVPVGDGDSPWPAQLAEAGALAISVLAWKPAPVQLPTQAPALILFDAVGSASMLHRDKLPWVKEAVRVASTAAVAEELARLGTPAHAVAKGSSLAFLEAARSVVGGVG